MREPFITVVVDVLRATTAFCAAFEAGVELIVPVGNLEKLQRMKNAGYLTAAERDGKKINFADFGNSPVLFLKTDFRGRSLAYSTTNGTHAIEMARKENDPYLLDAFHDVLTDRLYDELIKQHTLNELK